MSAQVKLVLRLVLLLACIAITVLVIGSAQDSIGIDLWHGGNSGTVAWLPVIFKVAIPWIVYGVCLATALRSAQTAK